MFQRNAIGRPVHGRTQSVGFGEVLRTLEERLRHTSVRQGVDGVFVDDGVVEHGAHLLPHAHHFAILLPVYHEDLGVGDVVCRLAEGDSYAVWE